MAKQQKSRPDQPATVFESIDRWHQVEADLLALKLEEARERPRNIEEDLEEWRALNDKQKRRKCFSKIRATFLKPLRQLQRLKVIGDDIIAGVDEGMKMYRIQRIVDSYLKQKSKVEESVQAATQLANDYPDISEQVGGFEWQDEIPAIKNDKGEMVLLTSEGTKVGSLTEDDGDDK